jgi:two-component system nitrogen regulation sensor histidine kinase NtrY
LRSVSHTSQEPAKRTGFLSPRGAAASDSGEKPSSEPRSGRSLPFTIGLITMVLSLCSGLATYLILTGLTPIVPNHTVVVGVLLINLLLVLAMVLTIAWQVTGLWLDRRRHVAGAQLHVRIVSLFSVIAVVPAILLAVFASVSLDRGLDHWFSDRTKSIIQNSIDVATAYLQEHGQVIRSDTVGMAKDIDEAVNLVQSQPQGFGNFLKAQAAIRALPVAYLIDGSGKVLATAASSPEFPYRAPPREAMALAKKGQVIVIAPGQTSLVGAIKSLANFDDTYLYVIRPVNDRVLQQLRTTRANVAEYQMLEQRRTGVQVAFGLMYVAMALTLLLSAIWIGMWFATHLVAPIGQLMGAAEEISKGNLGVKVEVDPADGDLAVLGSTFNTMASELKRQRDELVGANATLDERNCFMEAVLSGVTAGVVGVDTDGTVNLINRSGEKLLGVKEAKITGKKLTDAVPAFAPHLKHARKQSKRLTTDQVTLRRGGAVRNFAVRVTSEGAGQGYVVTFDDITELVGAQRSAAWADIARRIAHEIKNPLTPIQLSAERIRRKYGASITHDREIFDQCTDTIIRQVSDIGRMVDEFSDFARMPKPVMTLNDVREIVREAVFLFQVSRPDIKFELELPKKPVMTMSDRRLLTQAVTNLVKNASEAIDTAVEADPKRVGSGQITAKVSAKADAVHITVIDNGCGLPDENRDRLVEPYMTTRTKGTGLGLAIVQRITEQHGGKLRLADAPKRNGKLQGASVRIDLPVLDHDELEMDDDTPVPASSANASEPAEDEEGVSHGV